MKSSGIGCALALALVCGVAPGQENLLRNSGFETLDAKGCLADWGPAANLGKSVFVEREQKHTGQTSLRLRGTPHTWSTCSARPIAVRPNTNYWITWWFKARQADASRTYLFVQTNLAQRVFSHTDRHGTFDWTLNIVCYRTRADEKTLAPVLTVQTHDDPPGESWWDDLGVWERLPAPLEAIYRQTHPWDDVSVATAQRFAATEAVTVWGDRPETRIYATTPVPAEAVAAPGVALVAPGRGHDVYQLAVRPLRTTAPVTLVFHAPTGPGPMSVETLSYRVARAVNVSRVRDKSFPLGPTPDPLVEPRGPEPVEPQRNVLFWIEWAPPAASRPGVYRAAVDVVAGRETLARVPLELRRWACDLPEVSRFRSMVLVAPGSILRFYRGLTELEAYRRAWDALAAHRLGGFNVTAWPSLSLKEGRLQFDWRRFDALVAAAKQYRATAITIGPMFGGGCSQGWQPHKLLGRVPLADPQFDRDYVELNRQIAARLRAAGMLDRAYVYPYDEPEPDYMDKIARLCDLVHRGAPELKCLMTVDPQLARPLWGKVQAWIIPGSAARPEIVRARRAAGDEIWIYNMTAAIEDTPLAHRLYLWRTLGVGAQGALLWHCTWWNKINPWENPTAESVAVGRNWESFYHYQAGEASLLYPAPDGHGPLVPALRLTLIRQGVEDFDLVTALDAARRTLGLGHVAAKAYQALLAPVMLGPMTPTTCAARTEALRRLVGNELEAVGQRPAVIVYPTRIATRMGVAGRAEPGTRLTLNGRPLTLTADGRFELPVADADLAAGLRWTAEKQGRGKQWQWPGLQ